MNRARNGPLVRALLWMMLLACWTPALSAVTSTVMALQIDSGISISWPLLTSVFVLSSLSGATALVFRLDRELRANPGEPLRRPLLFCVAHMLGSWCAAALGFLIMQSMTSIDVWYKLAGVVMASFIGARFIENRAEAFLSRLPGGGGVIVRNVPPPNVPETP